MANALTHFMKTGDLTVPDKASLAHHLQRSAADNENMGGGGEYLQFSGKKGEFSVGRAKVPLDPDEVFLMEIGTFVEGWVCWKGSKPIGRHSWSIYQADEEQVFENELEDHGPYNEKNGEGWKKMRGFGFVSLDEKKKSIAFTNNSASGCNSIDDLKLEVRERVLNDEPELPLFAFYCEVFDERGNFKPMFDVRAWVTRDAVNAFYDGKLTYDNLLAGKAPRKRRKTR
jgi:hypothetical protein